MAWSNPAFEAVAGLVTRHAGLVFSPARTESAELGMRRAMTRAGVTDPDAYRALLAASPEALDDLLIELTIGETYFFREPAQFRFIRHEVLPERRRCRGEAIVRAWSCGCASGEEAYSLAIVLEEEGLGERSYLLATDLSRAALARARQARFGSWSLRGEGPSLALPYLRRQGPIYVLNDRLRQRVQFEQLNLAQDCYPSATNGTWGMDLILCRNVLIYFDRATVQAVARRLYEALVHGGWLFTASSDPPLAADAPFETVVTADGVFYRRGDGKAALSFHVTASPAVTPPPLPLPIVDATLRVASLATRSVASTIRPATVPLALPPWAPGKEPADIARADRGLVGDGPDLALWSPQSPGGLAPALEPTDPIAAARHELDQGNYARACELTSALTADRAASAVHIQALANQDTAVAEKACRAAVERHPLATELQYLHTMLLLDLRREEEAIRALRRVLYLDRTLAVAHFTLGTLLEQCGDVAGAGRAYRNARDLCAARPADELLPLSEGERAGTLARAAAARLALLDGSPEPSGRVGRPVPRDGPGGAS